MDVASVKDIEEEAKVEGKESKEPDYDDDKGQLEEEQEAGTKRNNNQVF